MASGRGVEICRAPYVLQTPKRTSSPDYPVRYPKYCLIETISFRLVACLLLFVHVGEGRRTLGVEALDEPRDSLFLCVKQSVDSPGPLKYP